MLSLALIAVFFTTPIAALAVAGGAAAVPIVIHLLNRKKYQVVVWAAMRFLIAAQRKNVRRLRIEQLLLLALRVLIGLLLVLALASVSPWAEPLWQRLFPATTSPLANQGRTHRIIVIDGSFSMATVQEDDSTRFETAKAQAKAILDRSPNGDGFSVVLLSSPAQTIVTGPADDRAKVYREIEQLKLPQGSADLSGGVRLVAEMVGKPLGKYSRREVTFISDLKRSTWNLPKPESGEPHASLGATSLAETWQTIARDARVIFLDVARQDSENLAVTSLTLGTSLPLVGMDTSVTTVVRNFGNQDRRRVPVELLVGKTPKVGQKLILREMGQQLVDVAPGHSVTVSFALDKSKRFTEAGEYILQVRIPEDTLKLDDTRTLIVRVRDTIPIMVVNGKEARNRLERSDEFVVTALNPISKDNPNSLSPFRPERRSLREFDDAGLSDLSKFDCVFLCDLPTVSAEQARRLETHLRRGGSVIIGLGPNSAGHLDVYNRILWDEGKGLLPGRMVGVKQAVNDGAFHFFAEEEAFRLPPLLDCFREDIPRSALSKPLISQYVQIESAPNGPARRILSFVPDKGFDDKTEPGKAATGSVRDAAVLDFPRFRGRVILFTTALNLDPKWNEWPGHPTFLALLNETTRYAVATDVKQTLTVGEPLDEYVSISQLGLTVKRSRWQHNEEEEIDTTEVLAQDDAGLYRFPTNDESGLFELVIGSLPEPKSIAVNVPTITSSGGPESDLHRIPWSDLQASAPDADLQYVLDASEIQSRRTMGNDGSTTFMDREPRGPGVARYLLLALFVLLLLEVFLAWRFGSARSGNHLDPVAPRVRRWGLYRLLWGGPLLLTTMVLGTILHAAITGEFLGFLPNAMRSSLEASLSVPPAAPGEGTRWRLERLAFLTGNPQNDTWWIGGLAILAGLYVVAIYRREKLGTASAIQRPFWRHPLVGLGCLRLGIVLLMLFVLLPQLRLAFEREGWPDVVIIFDDSRSMSIVDPANDPLFHEKTEELKREWTKLSAPRIEKIQSRLEQIQAQLAKQPSSPEAAKLGEESTRLQVQLQDLRTPHRLNLIKALLASSSRDWLQTLLAQRQMRVHLYRASAQVSAMAELTDPDQCARMLEEIIDMVPAGESSRLGDSVNTVLKTFRGGSLNAIIMFTDGVTTAGEDLPRSARNAARAGVPLYFVGVGDSAEPPDLILSDLRAENIINMNDRLVMEARIRSQGKGMPAVVPVILSEIVNGKPVEIARQMVNVSDKPENVKFTHTPKEAGEKQFVIEVPVQTNESDPTNNRLEHDVLVAEAKRVRVLYIEGRPRYEYRFIKTLFERETEAVRGNKSIELEVYLVGAHPDFAKQDKSAIAEFPTQERLNAYDVVILGDVDPRQLPRGEATVAMLAEFVKKRGGGLLMIAGEQFSPHAYKDTELADVLPLSWDNVAAVAPPRIDDPPIVETFRPLLTPAGQGHPIFRFEADDTENALLWSKLTPIRWYAKGYKRKLSAEILAVHPERQAEGGVAKDDLHPLVLQQFVGAGRVMFFGFDETWLWRWRQDEVRFNQFWMQTIRALARNRVGRIELRLDRKQFRRDEPIRVSVRFPDDAPPPAKGTEVKVTLERTPPKQPGNAPAEIERQTLQLAAVGTSNEPPSRTYEALLTRTPEGEYQFSLANLNGAGNRNKVSASVLPPLGEMDNRQLNEVDLQRAAKDSRGAYYPLAKANQLLDDLPNGPRVALDQPCEPLKLWNHGTIFLLFFSLLVTEWLLRKRWRLL